MSKQMNGMVPFEQGMADMYRDNPEMATEMLNQCIEDGNMEMFLVTLRQLARAFGGISQIAEATGLNENTLYRTLSRRGNPNLKTLVGIMDALGMRIAFVPKPSQASTI